MEETIEFFSPEGKPLRASITLTLSQQKILEAKFKEKVRCQHARPQTAK